MRPAEGSGRYTADPTKRLDWFSEKDKDGALSIIEKEDETEKGILSAEESDEAILASPSNRKASAKPPLGKLSTFAETMSFGNPRRTIPELMQRPGQRPQSAKLRKGNSSKGPKKDRFDEELDKIFTDKQISMPNYGEQAEGAVDTRVLKATRPLSGSRFAREEAEGTTKVRLIGSIFIEIPVSPCLG